MKFFIDYENVHAQGFRGVEFLSPEDEVVVFYSKNSQVMERGILKALYDSGCSCSIIRLANTGRNALDFYITSHIGETLGRGYCGAIGIVSHDKDFRAVYDYWLARNPEVKIIRKPDIARCIIATNKTADLRWQRVHQQYETVDLEEYYSRITKRNLIRKALAEALSDSDGAWRFDDLAKELTDRTAGRETYLALMREYGIQDGQAIYRVLKKIG